MSKFTDKLTNNKNIKREIVFADIGLVVLGLLMTIVPTQSNNIICTTGGILLGLWGLLKLVVYFASTKNAPFTSFGLVQGATLIVFAILLIFSNYTVAETLIKVMALILIISAILKIQYTVDFIRLKEKLWYVSLIGAVVSITMGLLVLLPVFDYAKQGVWRFLGISFLVAGLWDIISVIMLSNITKNLSLDEGKKKEKLETADRKRLRDKN
ncbi:MAG: hypothetical protein E7566_06915 [Ruminococcaceae bacterium]|nr:hypothetical protein [Oscillospiraceae bacterium]